MIEAHEHAELSKQRQSAFLEKSIPPLFCLFTDSKALPTRAGAKTTTAIQATLRTIT